MAQRILLLESESGFAERVRALLEERGARVDVMADGDRGVAHAAANPPDLVLLTVELPGTNGFLVCKRLRKTEGLDKVPIIILSNDVNADEIFEQHKKLRTRADDYLKKPVDAERVVEAAGRLVTLDHAAGDDADEEPLMIDDGDGDDDGHPTGTRGTVDDEIEAFAESAFDSLIVPDSKDDAGVSAAEHPAYAAAPAPAIPAAPAASERAASPAPEAPSPAPDGERLRQLEADLADARRRAQDAERFETEVRELRAQLERGGAASNRELLDLREQLNGKDRELLDLREQLGRRDKELLDARNESLQLGRTIADHEDAIRSLEGRVADGEARARTLDEEKANALRQVDDLQGRLRAADNRAEDLESRLEQTRAEAAREQERLGQERDAAISSLQQEHAQAVDALRGEHAAETQRREEETARRVADLEQQKADGLREAQESRDRALADQRRELDDRRERELADLREQHQHELGVLGRKLAETESTLGSTREQLSETQEQVTDLEGRLSTMTASRDDVQNELASARQRIGDLERHRDQLQSDLEALRRKASDDAALLDRARRALAIGLGLLEDQRAGHSGADERRASSTGTAAAPSSG